MASAHEHITTQARGQEWDKEGDLATNEREETRGGVNGCGRDRVTQDMFEIHS